MVDIDAALLAMVPADELVQLVSPNWKAGRWRWEHYVDSRLRPLWVDLSLQSKLVAYLLAADMAQWDEPSD